MRIDLPFPNKALWPNGGARTNYHKLNRLKQSHKNDAMWAAKAGGASVVLSDGPIRVHLTVHAKPKGPLPDRDNCVAALKAYQDGIAAAIGIDDKHFREPTVSFAEPRNGRFVIEIGELAK